MHPVFNRNIYLIKDNPVLSSPSKDIYDPISNKIIMECREINSGLLRGMLRVTHLKIFTPFDFLVRTHNYDRLLTVSKSCSLFQSHIAVINEDEKPIGKLIHDMSFKVGGDFELLNTHDKPQCQLKGDWLSWSFSFMKDGIELARITNKYDPDHKPDLKYIDGYVLQICKSLPKDDPVRQLILATTVYIDIFLKV